MLPIIIKLLKSKIIQKKGAINKKSIHVRRQIVFQFFASFDPIREFPTVINEFLRPVSLTLDDCQNSAKVIDRLSRQSFAMLVSFVS